MAEALPAAVAELLPFVGDAEQLRVCKVSCKGAQVLPQEAVLAGLRALPQWSLSADGKAISRSLVAKNFKAALQFLNDVGAVAEEEGHHPDMHLTGYRTVCLELSTHDVAGGGLTLPDFALAAKIDALHVECSPKWLREQAAARAMRERLAAVGRFIELRKECDRDGLLGMLASPCDLCGEPAPESIDAYLESWRSCAEAEVTSPPCAHTAGDPLTVRVGFTRSGGEEVTELFTFSEAGDITRVGYAGPPPEPEA